LVIGYYIFNNEPTPIQNEPLVVEIVKDSIIRDSIYIINDSIRTEIKYIKEKYIEDSTNIMVADDSMLLYKFTEYIEEYSKRLD